MGLKRAPTEPVAMATPATPATPDGSLLQATPDDVAPTPVEALPEPTSGSDPDIADDEDAGPQPGRPRIAAVSPLLDLPAAELARRFKTDPFALGTISAGPPRAGVLVNGVQMPAGPGWLLLDPGHAWGTRETVDGLALSIERVRQRFPDTAPLPIGHISAKGGGHLSPHLSHQSGRDVDVSYYTRGPQRAFVTVNADSIDLPRTWTLVKTALTETPIDMIFIDSAIQKALADFAVTHGETAAFVDDAFQVRGKNAAAPIRHIRGHANHLHIRFHAPLSEELGARLARWLPRPAPPPPRPTGPSPRPTSTAQGKTGTAPAMSYEQIRARSGDTLVVWAKRYNTTVEEIQRANGLTSIALKIGTVYRIPVPAKALVAAPPAQATGDRKTKPRT